MAKDASIDRERRLRFMEITGDTGLALKELWTIVEPRLPAILDEFYDHLASEPELVPLVGAQSQRLKQAQHRHWALLFSGTFDSEYMQSIRTVGLTHNRVGLEPRWYVASYKFVLNRLAEVAIEKYRRSPAKLSRAISALNAAALLDMELAISVYQEAMMAERAERQRKLEAAIAEFDAAVGGVIGSVAAAASQMQSSARSMSSNAEQTQNKTAAVAGAAGQASANVQTVATASDELSGSIAEIGRQAATSTRIASQAVAEARRTDEKVQSLAAAAQRIGTVITLINDIAAQTNLLALNATIEAARAGEAGKGFAVVASEVKGLANQTARATDEIAEQVSAMQAATGESVSAIGAIEKTIAEMNEIAAAIAAAVEEQSAATHEIARNVQEAARGTQEVSSNIRFVAEAASDTGAAAVQITGSAQSLAREADTLRQQVDRFLAEARSA